MQLAASHSPGPLCPTCPAALHARRAQQSCCGSSYIPTDPAAPALLEPWEWGEWLAMCKTGGDIEAALSEWLGGRRSWGVGAFGWRGQWLCTSKAGGDIEASRAALSELRGAGSCVPRS